MTWVRVDDQFPDHPKLLRLGKQRLPAMGLWVTGLCYSARFLTDGFIPSAALPYGSKRIAQLLVDVGLWGTADGGYQIHDYQDYQPTRQQVLETRARNAASGRRGGQAKGKQDASEPLSETLAPRLNGASPVREAHPIPIPSTEVLLNVPEYIEPSDFYEERVGRKPSQKVKDWLEDLHARFSRKELIHAMTAVPGAKERNWLNKVDAYLENVA